MELRSPMSLVLLALCCCCSTVLSQADIEIKNCLPPSLKSEGSSRIYTIGNEDIQIPCRATGNATLEYSWTKDGEPFDLQSESNLNRVFMKPDEGTLVIQSTKKEDTGAFQCKVTNNCGTALSKLTTLLYAEIEPFAHTPTKELRPVLGSSAVLTCNPPRSVPKAIVAWILQDPQGGDDAYEDNIFSQEGVIKQNTVKLDKRVTMDFNGNLYITTVKEEDEQDGKTYVCQANNLQSRSSNKGEDTVIKVQGKIPSSNNVRLMWHSQETLLVLQGRKARFKCIFSGNPPPDVSWRREKGELDRARMKENHHDLFFENVQFEDEGQYSCIGKSSVSNPVTQTFTLQVEAKPMFRSIPRDQTVGVEESATFLCEANGRPKPVIQWYINGVPYENVPPNPRRELKGNSLVFTNLDKSDSQVIQCNASNIHGSIWADVFLFVQALPPTIVTPPKEELIVAESQVLRVSCEVTGKPKPDVVWYRGDQHLPPSDEYQIQENGDLIITEALKKYRGTYKCIATNRYGTKEAKGEVIVKTKTVIDSAPQNNTVIYPGNATFTCGAQTDMTEVGFLRYRWLKDGQPLEPSKRVVIQGGVLHILESTSKDTGNYTCVAESRLDNATATATLSVKAVPDPPYNVTVVDCLASSVLLRWRFDDKMKNFVEMKKFIVEAITDSNKLWRRESVPHQSREVSFELSPYAKYVFRVKAVNKLGISEPSKVTNTECSTPMAVPDRNPSNVHIDPQHTGYLTVKWDPMEEIELNGPEFRYVIEIQEPGGEVESYTQANYTLGEIRIPVNNTYKPYNVRVRAVNQFGKAEDDTPKTVSGFSGEAVPLVVPENFEQDLDVTLTATSAGFKWDKVNTSVELIQGKFMGYRIRFWKKGQKDNYNWVDIPEPEPVRRRRREDSDDGKVRGHVANLPSNAEIELDVVVVNQNFESNGSNVVTIITDEGVPGEVSYFEALYRGSHHFLLEWGLPREPNGNITGYRISYQRIKILDFEDRVYKEDRNPDDRRMNLNGLEPNSEYRVYIQAMTRIGLGKEYYIDVVTQKVTLDVALPEVSSVAQTDTEANVTWKMVAPGKGIRYGQYYQIQYRKKGDNTWRTEEFIVDRRFWALVEHLKPGTNYQVRVASYAHPNDNPRWSKPYSFTTTGISASRASFLTAAWFIAMMIIIALLILLLIIVCIIKRNRGDNYPVQEKERLRGNCDDNPDHFNEIGKGDDNGVGRSSTFDGDIEKVPLDEDTDSLDYGDDNASKFNEDGSFIGQYGRGEKGAEGTNASSIV